MVEFGRTCYRSKWYLFRGQGVENVLVEGRYYFAPEGTRHAPLHNLGSKQWNDGNWQIQQALGEDLATKREFDHGELPPRMPRDTIVGSLVCLRDGDKNSIPYDQTIAGFVPACFTIKEQENQWYKVSEFSACVTQRNVAYIIKLLTENNSTEIVNVVEQWLGATVQTTINFGEGIFPSFAILKDQDWIALICNGTETAQQFALQAFGSLLGPINYGIYSTLPLWYSCSTFLYDKLIENGMTTDSRVFLAGHSYGGAAVLNLVARLKFWLPEREVRYLTFGCPKIGDTRLVRRVNSAPGISILNTNDIVGILPPDLSLTSAVFGNFTLSLLSLFNLWQPAPGRVLLAPSGQLRAEEPFVVAQNVLNDLIQDAIDGDPFPTFPSHFISEYLDRTLIRCPGVVPVVIPCATLYGGGYGLVASIASSDIPEIDGLTGGSPTPPPDHIIIITPSAFLTVVLFNSCYPPTGGGSYKPGCDWLIELSTGPNANIYATEVRDMDLDEILPDVVYSQTIELTDIGGSPTGKYATLTFTFVPYP